MGSGYRGCGSEPGPCFRGTHSQQPGPGQGAIVRSTVLGLKGREKPGRGRWGLGGCLTEAELEGSPQACGGAGATRDQAVGQGGMVPGCNCFVNHREKPKECSLVVVKLESIYKDRRSHPWCRASKLAAITHIFSDFCPGSLCLEPWLPISVTCWSHLLWAPSQKKS